MPRQFFSCRCPKCQRAHELEVQRLGFDHVCEKCGAVFSGVSADSRSAAWDSPMDYWIRYTNDPRYDLETNQEMGNHPYPPK